MRLWPFLLIPSFICAAEKPRAYPTCTSESIERVSRASQCWDQSDFGCTKLKLQAVLDQQPQCAQALYLYSFVLERDGKTDQAEAMREKAEKLDPQLKDFWEERAHFIESELSTQQEFSHFDVRFYGAEDRSNAWHAVQFLNDAYNELISDFGVEPAKRVQVIVFTTDEFMDAWRAPFIGGFFDRRDGKVRIRVDEMPNGSTDEFRRVARHEFTHAYMHQLYGKDLPAWFLEGSAEFYAYRNRSDGYWKEKRLEELRKLFRGQKWRPLAGLQRAIDKKSEFSPLDVYLAYQQSAALILSVAKDRGESWMPRLFAQMRAGQSFDAAYAEVIGVSPDRSMESLHHAWE